MNDFWQSGFGAVDGAPSSAFNLPFKTIPNDSYLKAGIVSSSNKETKMTGDAYVNITWQISEGVYSGRRIWQNLFVYGKDSPNRCQDLNMLRLVFDLFGLTIGPNAPTDDDLSKLVGHLAGLRILETQRNATGNVYNRVVEVHPIANFVERIGSSEHNPKNYDVVLEKQVYGKELNDDVPF